MDERKVVEMEEKKEDVLKYYHNKVLKSIKGYPKNLIYDIFIKDELEFKYHEYRYKKYSLDELEEHCESILYDFKYNCGWCDLEERVDCWLKTLNTYEITLIQLRYNNKFDLQNFFRKGNEKRNYSIYANTLEDIALNSSVTKERVRQCIMKAFWKLKHPSRLKYFKSSAEDLRRNEIKELTDVARAQSKKECRDRMVEMHEIFYKNFSDFFKDEQGVVDENFEKFFQTQYNAVLEEDFELNSKIAMRIDDLELSIRSYNCLKRAGVKLVLDLIEMSFDDLTHVRNLGKKSIDEIVDKIHSLGLKFDDPEIDKII